MSNIIYIKSLTETNIRYSHLVNPETTFTTQIPKFNSTQRYGWFKLAGNGLTPNISPQQYMNIHAWNESDSISYNICYVYFQKENGILRSFSLNDVVFQSSEKNLISLFISQLYTGNFDIILSFGINQPRDYINSLCTKYKIHQAIPSNVELLDVKIFCQNYGFAYSIKSDTDIKILNQKLGLITYLTNAANVLGISRELLLNKTIKVRSSVNKSSSIILKNVAKQTDRLALLKVLLDNDSEKYSDFEYMPTEFARNEVYKSSDLLETYKSLLTPSAFNLNGYTYSASRNKYLQPIAELSVVVYIPIEERVHSKEEYTQSYYLFELRDDYILESNVVLNKQQEDSIKRLMMTSVNSKKDIEHIMRVIRT